MFEAQGQQAGTSLEDLGTTLNFHVGCSMENLQGTLEAHNTQLNLVYETLIQIELEFCDFPHQFIWFINIYNI